MTVIVYFGCYASEHSGRCCYTRYFSKQSKGSARDANYSNRRANFAKSFPELLSATIGQFISCLLSSTYSHYKILASYSNFW